jgi:hypothetical protein
MRTGTDNDTEFTVDLDSLPAGEGANLMRLISETKFFELPENLGMTGALDEPQYVITVRYGGDRHHTVHVNNAAVPKNLRPLVDELVALADMQST